MYSVHLCFKAFVVSAVAQGQRNKLIAIKHIVFCLSVLSQKHLQCIPIIASLSFFISLLFPWKVRHLLCFCSSFPLPPTGSEQSFLLPTKTNCSDESFSVRGRRSAQSLFLLKARGWCLYLRRSLF